MELHEAIRRRRMVRSFSAEPIDHDTVHLLVDDALRSPTAGNTKGVAWIVLEGDRTALYWSSTTTDGWRRTSRRWPGLSRAPVAALCLSSPAAYLARYGEPDKARSRLGPVGVPDGEGVDGDGAGGEGVDGEGVDGEGVDGEGGGGEGAWVVPYWFGDAAFSTMLLLLGAVGAGLGACFLGNFRGEEALLATLGVDDGWRLFGSVLLGYPDGHDYRSASLDRADPATGGRIRWGRW